MSKLHLFLVTYLGIHSLALPVLAHSDIRLWLVSISDENSLSEIALSGASKLASAYFTLFYRNVHVLYTGIGILVMFIIAIATDRDVVTWRRYMKDSPSRYCSLFFENRPLHWLHQMESFETDTNCPRPQKQYMACLSSSVEPGDMHFVSPKYCVSHTLK